MAINDLYTAQWQFEGAGSGFTVTLAYEQTGGTNDQDTLSALAVALATLMEQEFKDVMGVNVDTTGILTYQATGTNETPGRTRFEQPNAGSIASDVLPMGGAAVLSFHTVAPNAKHNGRIYISAIPESFSDNGEINATGKAAYEALAVAILATIPPVGTGSAIFRAVVISRIEDGEVRVPAVGFVIDSIRNVTFVKNQRRRNTRFIGVGPA